jgi:hypothetical protein
MAKQTRPLYHIKIVLSKATFTLKKALPMYVERMSQDCGGYFKDISLNKSLH